MDVSNTEFVTRQADNLFAN